jgi:dihydrofolate synthase/folylpolyglutamate synthase
MLAYLFFDSHNVDYAVLEVGMGGRLDATNACHSICSIITSIGFDHTEFLGDTLEKIAFEKAGIIKPATPVILGSRAEPLEVFSQRAKELHSPLIRAEGSFDDFNQENTATAHLALQYLGLRYDPGFLKVKPPLRACLLKHKGYNYFFDVAHNGMGFEALAHYFDQPPLACIGFSEGKDYQSSIRALLKITQEIYIAPFDHERSCSLLTLKTLEHVRVFHSFKESLGYAQSHACGRTILVAGSFFMMKEVFDVLGIEKEQIRASAAGLV